MARTAPQLDLFARSSGLRLVPREPDLERIRLILGDALRELQASPEMPWKQPRLRSWQHVFQNMTKWLASEEQERFLREFEGEVHRLSR